MSSVSVQPRGTAFTRLAIALGVAKGDPIIAERYAYKNWGPGTVLTILSGAAKMGSMDLALWDSIEKSAVAAGTTSDATWAGPLAQYRAVSADFLEAVNARTALGRLTQLRRVPPKALLPRETSGVTAGWVGEGRPYPAGRASTDAVSLEALKIGCIVPMSADLLRNSDSRAETLVRRNLVNGAAALGDQSFFDPNQAGIADIQPPSITYGLTPLTSSGSVLTDLEEMVNAYSGDLDTAALVTDKFTGVQIGLRNAGSNSVVVGAKGGEAVGIPVFVTDGMPRGSSGGRIVLLDQAQIPLADEGVSIDYSQNAAIEFNDAPSGGAQQLRSLWQNGLCAFRLTRYLAWDTPVAGSVVLLEDAFYPG
jgi:HK97 family phage major capsid protein